MVYTIYKDRDSEVDKSKNYYETKYSSEDQIKTKRWKILKHETLKNSWQKKTTGGGGSESTGIHNWPLQQS